MLEGLMPFKLSLSLQDAVNQLGVDELDVLINCAKTRRDFLVAVEAKYESLPPLEQLHHTARDHILAGHMIHGIKALRAHYNLGLVDAKNAYDWYRLQFEQMDPNV